MRKRETIALAVAETVLVTLARYVLDHRRTTMQVESQISDAPVRTIRLCFSGEDMTLILL